MSLKPAGQRAEELTKKMNEGAQAGKATQLGSYFSSYVTHHGQNNLQSDVQCPPQTQREVLLVGQEAEALAQEVNKQVQEEGDPVGALQTCLHAWEAVGTSKIVLQWIS